MSVKKTAKKTTKKTAKKVTKKVKDTKPKAKVGGGRKPKEPPKKPLFTAADARKTKAEKIAAVKDTIAALRSKYGDEVVMSLRDKPKDVPVISTGSIQIDEVTHIGGIPRGRIIEIYGPEGSGKTTLALHMIAEAQNRGDVCAFIDAEHALDLNYAQRIGVDTDDLLICQPDCGEQGLNVVEDFSRTSGIGLIVVDSVAALTPRAEIEGEVGDSHVGLHARMMGQALRKLAGIVSKTGTAVIFINQIRMKIAVMYGSPETTTGGRALPYFASMRIDIRRIALLKDGDKAIGNRAKVKIVKNKLAPPFGEVEVDIIWGLGIDPHNDLLAAAIACGVVEKAGAWLSYANEQLAQGLNNAVARLKAEPELAQKIRTETEKKLGIYKG